MPYHRPMTQAQREREWLDSCRGPGISGTVLAFILQGALVALLVVVFL